MVISAKRAAPLVKKRQYLAQWEKRGRQKAQTWNQTKQRNIKIWKLPPKSETAPHSEWQNDKILGPGPHGRHKVIDIDFNNQSKYVDEIPGS